MHSKKFLTRLEAGVLIGAFALTSVPSIVASNGVVAEAKISRKKKDNTDNSDKTNYTKTINCSIESYGRDAEHRTGIYLVAVSCSSKVPVTATIKWFDIDGNTGEKNVVVDNNSKKYFVITGKRAKRADAKPFFRKRKGTKDEKASEWDYDVVNAKKAGKNSKPYSLDIEGDFDASSENDVEKVTVDPLEISSNTKVTINSSPKLIGVYKYRGSIIATDVQSIGVSGAYDKEDLLTTDAGFTAFQAKKFTANTGVFKGVKKFNDNDFSFDIVESVENVGTKARKDDEAGTVVGNNAGSDSASSSTGKGIS